MLKDKIKGFLGFCQYDNCWKRAPYALEIKGTKENGEVLNIIECNLCKDHAIKITGEFEVEQEKGRWGQSGS